LKISKITGTIHIDNNWSDAKDAGICTGSGIYSDPYVIENLIIDGGGTVIGILIENSNDSFILRNCTIYNLTYGIELDHVQNGRLVNNNCSFNWYGIALFASENNTLSGNIVNNNTQVGTMLYESNNCTISGNTANYNDWNGIRLSESNNNSILENTVYNNFYGIDLEDSDNNTISGNTVNNSIEVGIDLTYSNYNTLSTNIANYNQYGIYLEHSNFNIISGNILIKNDKCINQKEDCEGNIFENNECVKHGGIIPGYNLIVLLGIIFVVVIITHKKIKKS